MIHLPFTSSVRGVSFYPENTAKVRINAVVECIPDPQNQHDSNAIAIYHKGLHLGFLPAKLSTNIMNRVDTKNFKLMGVVSEKYFNGEFHALKIKVSRFVDVSSEVDLVPVAKEESLVKDENEVVKSISVLSEAENIIMENTSLASTNKDETTAILEATSTSMGDLKTIPSQISLEAEVALYNRSGRFLGRLKSITNGMVLAQVNEDLEALYPIAYVKYR